MGAGSTFCFEVIVEHMLLDPDIKEDDPPGACAVPFK